MISGFDYVTVYTISSLFIKSHIQFYRHDEMKESKNKKYTTTKKKQVQKNMQQLLNHQNPTFLQGKNSYSKQQ